MKLFTLEQAAAAAEKLGVQFEKEKFTLGDFHKGMQAELQHGTAKQDTNITNDDPLTTAKLALCHLRISPFYYAPNIGVKAWENSLLKGVKKQGMKTEYKTIQFKQESYDEESGVFEGYGAVVGNLDSGGDIIEPGAFTKTIAEGWERVKILALHNDQMLPIGRPIELREDSRGLYIKAKISDTSMGKDVKVLLRDGVLNELSIGYDPVVFDYDEEGIRHLREVKLWEVSVVTWAMNPEAMITDFKAVENAQRAAQMVRDMAGNKKRKLATADRRQLQAAKAVMLAAVRKIDETLEPQRKATGGKKPPACRAQKSPAKQTIEIIL